MRVASVSWMVVLAACVVDHQGLGAPRLDAMREDIGPDASTDIGEDVGRDVAPDGPVDECPLDPMKTTPGACGCGTPDIDADGDRVFSCDAATCGIGFSCGDCDDASLTNETASCQGCADATREGFASLTMFPSVAACGGAFLTPGIVASVPTCEHMAGNNGDISDGTGCSAADLCADGWSPCVSNVVFEAKGGQCADIGIGPNPAFFAAGISGDGFARCNGMGMNDMFGCGTVGSPPGDCPGLSRHIADCGFLSPAWMCGSTPETDAATVIKPGIALGGVLCCRD